MKDARRRQAVLTGVGNTALNAGHAELALHAFQEARSGALALGDPSYQFEAEVGIVRALVQSQQFEAAGTAASNARQLEPNVANTSFLARYGSDLSLAEARIAWSRRDARRVMQLTDDALARVSAVSSEYRHAELRLLRGRALRSVADPVGAREEFLKGIEHVEARRARLAQDANRISFLDAWWDLYSEIVSLTAIDLKDPLQALQIANQSRARVLEERLRSGGEAVDLSAIPNNAAVLFISSTESGLLLWFASADGIKFHASALTPDQTRSLVRRLTATVTGEAADSAAILRSGYEALIAPFAAGIGSVRRLIIVPDAGTQAVPFGALQNPNDGSYLVDAVVPLLSPNLTTALRWLSRAADAAPATTAVFSQTAALHNLPELPAANREVDAIRRLYRESVHYQRDEASLDALRTALSKYDVVHLAIHATSDPRDPDHVSLALARTTGPVSTTALQSSHRTTNLVVLAACNSAVSRRSRSETALSVARPFIAAGVPAVVVALAEVPDARTADLMTAFHASVAAGAEPAAALAAVQRLEARRFTQPWWSVFTMIVS
jgi:CHAT domain-containing protein